MNFVTDTHALVWWFVDSPRLSRKVREVFEQCENGEYTIFVPSIVIAEALSIFDNKRISFDFKKLFNMIEESENFVIIPLDYPILLKMVDLKDIPELHDKIIVSTALYLDLPVITKDRTLIKLSPVNTIW
ncbi:MAG: type II toxin-antitoxin system VapC family toxin [Proteobacteria bacterium]|nr:type II toxin-antitoxin system VapC family toxin [Pseudomonadota bacterium]